MVFRKVIRSARVAWPGRRSAGIAAIAGVLAACGQEPLGLWPVALLGYALLIRGVATAPRGAGWLGLIGGAAHFAVALSWIAEPFLVDAAAYGWMIPFAVVFLSCGLALFWMAAALVARRLPNPAMALAIMLTLAEILRGNILTGFPWALPGHIWFQTPVVQLASMIGGYGLTLLTLLAAAGLSRMRAAPTMAAAALVACAWGFGAYDLSRPAPAPRDVTLRLIQPNTAQALKWDRALAQTHFDRLLRLTADGPARDLTIWPETALPYALEQHSDIFGMIAATSHSAPVAIGAQRIDGDLAWNSLTVIAPDGAETARYDKAHLVPFGEYIPAGDVMYRLFGLRAFASQAGAGYTAGPGPRVIDLGGKLGKVLPLICYEAVFPQDVRAAPERADWILQITNDAWFGSLTGPFQHAALSRLRAIEMGLPLVRVGNTGVTVVYDARGRTTARLPFQTEGALDAALPGALPPTPYARFGESPVLLLLAALSLTLFWRRGRSAA